MPLIYQSRIVRNDLKANPNIFYVFGDNAERRGMGGQAKEMRGEPNAFGIITKRSPKEFLDDTDHDWVAASWDNDFNTLKAHLRVGRHVIIPLFGIGTGLAQLPIKAPRLWDELISNMKELEQWTAK